uniref:Endonuclease/exonuclease/phosphatase domain-containing protein n=1 Tax=Kalanchoe fedtschenkoi TaxID=63787 RepID=A0A7N0VCC1_KALFE
MMPPTKPPTYLMINLASWNVRGINSPFKQKEVVNYISSNSIHFFGLLETKLSSSAYSALQQKFSRQGSWNFVSNFETHSHGRILLSWNSSIIKSCQVLFLNPQFIHCSLSTDFYQFQVTTLYAFNQKISRVPLWSDLLNIALSVQVPWLVFGDFNSILSTQDKFGSNASLRDTEELSHFCSASNLTDIPYTGYRFTWSNRREISTRCKLDRIMCNSLWMSAFPSSHAIFANP